MADSDNPVMIPADALAGLPVTADDDAFDELAKSGDFLPRIQLMGSGSDAVKKGTFPMAHYALVHNKDKMDDLTEEVDMLVITWRPKAMDVNGEQVISVFDKDAPEFKRIVEEAGNSDSGCMFGPEFLVWLKSANQFATFFFASKSARRVAPNMKALLQKAATARVKFIETKKYSWHAPEVVACGTQFDIPDTASIREQAEKFVNPPVSEVEKDTEAESDSRER